MKIKLFFALLLLVMIAACGTSSTDSMEEGRLISGEIESDTLALMTKSAVETDSCVNDICGVMAYNSDGSETAGEIDPYTHRWHVRVRNGNWMFGFLDGSGQRLGFLALNGITSLTVDDGEDVELGLMRFGEGIMVMLSDLEGFGNNGIHSYYGADKDRDGIPSDFDSDETDEALNDFDILFIRPYDGQPHVAPCRPIKIVFTMPLDDASVTQDAILVEYSDGTPVNGDLTIWEDAEYQEYEVIFSPSGGYVAGETVYVTVISGPDGVLSETGEVLVQDLAVSFAVRDFGSSSTTCHDPDQERQTIRVQERERNQGPQ